MSVMKLCIGTIAVALFISAPVVADTFVIASPDMSLTEAAQAKFNHDNWTSDRNVKPVPGTAQPSPQLYASAGLTPEEAQGWTLEQVHVAKINRESSGGERQLAPASISRGYGQGGGDYSRLASAAGLSPDEAASMSVWEIATAKLNSEH
jgi:hypothetical protein